MSDSLDNAHISAGDGPDTLPFIEPPKGQGLVDIVAALTPQEREFERLDFIATVKFIDGKWRTVSTRVGLLARNRIG